MTTARGMEVQTQSRSRRESACVWERVLALVYFLTIHTYILGWITFWPQQRQRQRQRAFSVPSSLCCFSSLIGFFFPEFALFSFHSQSSRPVGLGIYRQKSEVRISVNFCQSKYNCIFDSFLSFVSVFSTFPPSSYLCNLYTCLYSSHFLIIFKALFGISGSHFIKHLILKFKDQSENLNIIKKFKFELTSMLLDLDRTGWFDRSGRKSTFFSNWFVAQNNFSQKSTKLMTRFNWLTGFSNFTFLFSPNIISIT